VQLDERQGDQLQVDLPELRDDSKKLRRPAPRIEGQLRLRQL
jgi:hypothetical protein